MAMEFGGAIRPDDNFTTITVRNGVSADLGSTTHIRLRGVLNLGIISLKVTADTNLTTTGESGGIDA